MHLTVFYNLIFEKPYFLIKVESAPIAVSVTEPEEKIILPTNNRMEVIWENHVFDFVFQCPFYKFDAFLQVESAPVAANVIEPEEKIILPTKNTEAEEAPTTACCSKDPSARYFNKCFLSCLLFIF